MKKIFITLLLGFFGLVCYGQLKAPRGLIVGDSRVSGTNIVVIDSMVASKGPGILSIDTLKFYSGATKLILIGVSAKYLLKHPIDSLGTIGTAVGLYNSTGDTLPSYIPFSGRTNVEDWAVMLADSTIYPHGYASLSDFKATLTPRVTGTSDLGTSTLMYGNLFLKSTSTINFNNGDVVLTHVADNLDMTGGQLHVTYANPGNAAIYGFNSAASDGSSGVWGRTYYEGATTANHYGVLAQSDGPGANNTNIGLFASATTGGVENIAVWASDGDVIIDDNLVYEQDATGTSVTAAGGIEVIMLSAYILFNEDSAINISADPQIANPSRAGTVIIIQGSSDTNTLTLEDGTGLQLAGNASCVLGAGDIISLIYNGTDWFELYRANN